MGMRRMEREWDKINDRLYTHEKVHDAAPFFFFHLFLIQLDPLANP